MNLESPMLNLKSFVSPKTVSPTDMPSSQNGRVSANDNLKPENVQIELNSIFPSSVEEAIPAKSNIYFRA